MRRIGTLIGFLCICQAALADSRSPDSAVHTLSSAAPEFLQTHCIDCHDGADGEGGFDISQLSADLNDRVNLEKWVRVFDRVQQGEMPPPDSAEIEPKSLSKFLRSTQSALQKAESAIKARNGRVQGRRLSNQQLERTLQDILKIAVPVSRLLPPEQRTHGYVHLADSQAMSHFQLQGHLQVVDKALDTAFDYALKGRSDFELDYGAEKIANKRKGRRNRDPEMRKGAAVVWSSTLVFYGRISSTTVKEDGWYDIELTASAVKSPRDRGVWCSVRSGECVSSAPLLTWIGSFQATDQPKTMRYRAWIPANHRLEVRPADVTLKRARFAGGQVGYGEGEPQNVPGLAMHRLKMTRVYPGGSVKQVRQRLLGKSSVAWDRRLKQSLPVLADRSPKAIQHQLGLLLTRFASLSFRRPVAAGEIASYLSFATSVYEDEGESPLAFVNALRAGYRAILCSPRFLYFNEPNDSSGHLDHWSIASRLSYFLCGSMPDQLLWDAAARGELGDSANVWEHAERLLKTQRGKDFIADFSSQWLDLIDIDFTEPDRRLFGDFDPVVQNAMLAETQMFLQKLLDENRPVAELVNADYTFLNSRLARYYELKAGELAADDRSVLSGAADSMQLVSLKPASARGGLLGQGAILKVTANGNDTSPVLRGIWVSERILGKEIPPPPANVPAVEPDIRGAKTIRDLLAKHQADPGCAACHQHFDPPGFALENFDAGGKWRDQYRQKDKGKYKRGPKVDASFEMKDGRSFESYQQFCQMIAKSDDQLASNLVSQLLVYATGATIKFSDREVIQSIVEKTQSSRHGVRDLLQQVVTSKTFLSK